MERPYPSVEFEAEITPEGAIIVPRPIAASFRPGMPVTVRLTEGVVSTSLRKRGISEETIERMAALQLEQRDHVVEFLSAEGSLAKGTFNKRAGSRRRSR